LVKAMRFLKGAAGQVLFCPNQVALQVQRAVR